MVPPRGDVANEQNVSYVNAKSEKALSISCLCCVPVPTCITFPNQGNPSIALWRKKKIQPQKPENKVHLYTSDTFPA